MSITTTNKADILANEIFEELTAHGLKENEQIPSIRELSARYNVCKHTVSVALSRLTAKGFIRQEQGRGTFITKPTDQKYPQKTSDIAILQTSVPCRFAESSEGLSGFTGEIIRGASSAAGKFNQFLLVRHILEECNIINIAEIELALGHELKGFIAEYAPGLYDIASLKEFANRGNLVFFNNANPELETNFVGTDNIEAGRLAAKHLISAGHSRIGFITWRPSVSSIYDRLTGYRIALAEAQIPYDETLIDSRLKDSPENDYNVAESIHYLVKEKKADSLICINDGIQSAVCNKLLAKGFIIPDDIAVIGFDNSFFAINATMPLSVISQDPLQIGYQAASIAYGPYSATFRKLLLAPSLIRRATT